MVKDLRTQLWEQGLCTSSTPIRTTNGVVVAYCTKPRASHPPTGEQHSDGTHVWDCAFADYSPRHLAALLREPQTKVRDWKGDPKRDPRLIKDLSSLFVAPPSFRK